MPHHHWVIRRQRRFTNQPIQRNVDSGTSARTRDITSNQIGPRIGERDDEDASRFFQPYNPEILITRKEF